MRQVAVFAATGEQQQQLSLIKCGEIVGSRVAVHIVVERVGIYPEWLFYAQLSRGQNEINCGCRPLA